MAPQAGAMENESEARPLPIRGDSDDEWLEELLGARHAADPSQPTEPVARGGCRAELPAEAEGEWLVELLGAHRAAASSQPAQPVAWGGCRAELRPVQPVAWGGCRAEQPAEADRAGRRAEAAAPRAFPLHTAGGVVGGSGAAGAAIPFPATSELQSLLEQEEALQGEFGFGPLEEALANPRQDQLLWALCGVRREAGRSGWREAAYLHCLRRFLSWRVRLGPMAFKIGIASDPHDRYHNDEFGYEHEGIWHFMEVTAMETAQVCRLLERWLIRTLKMFPGCQNVRAGGDGVRADRTHTCFVYMVVAAAGTGRSLAAARRARIGAEIARGSHSALARRG